MSIFTPIAARIPERVKSFVRTISLRSYLSGLIVTLVVGGGYLAWGRSGTTLAVQNTVSPVTRRDIVSSVKAVGKVTFSSEQQMKFNQRGTVTSVNVKEGDKVKKGQLLAQLDATSITSDIRQAQLAISASQLQLQQLEADKAKTIGDAQTDLKVSQQKLPSDLASAQRTVDEKKAAVQQAQLDLEKQSTTEIQGFASTAQSVVVSSEGLLDSFYSMLTLGSDTRPTTTDTRDLVISNYLYNDPVLKQKVEFAYLDAIKADQTMRQTYGTTLATERDPQKIVKALQDAGALAKSIYTLGELTYTLLQGATTDTRTFTPSDLDSVRSDAISYRTKAADLMSQIDTAQANLAAVSSSGGVPSVTLKQKQDALTSAQNALQVAQDNLSVLQTQTPADLQSKQQALDSTMSSVDINIRLKQNSISQQIASLQKTQKTLNDYRLVAPFDGVITHLDYKVGDNLLDTGDTEYLMLQNPDFIVVTIPLDQVDVVRIKQGLPATITFDAVPGQQFTGTVDSIDSSPVEQSGVVSYNVSIKLPTPKDLNILSGMTATVNIETSSAKGVLAVPNLAIQRQGGTATVRRATGESVPVELGATDGRYTEIKSGLNEGDSVVSLNVSATATSSGNNPNAAQQLLRGGGGGFGGGTATFQRRGG